MIKKFLKKFSLNTAEKELEDYLVKVSIGNSEQHGMILARACLIYAQLVKKLPILKDIMETKEDVYGGEVADLILETNSILKEYNNSGEAYNAAGLKLLNETLRCLAHPELTHLGKEIWSYFTSAQKEAEEYLDSLESGFAERENDDMVTKVGEAKQYITFVPVRYNELK